MCTETHCSPETRCSRYKYVVVVCPFYAAALQTHGFRLFFGVQTPACSPARCRPSGQHAENRLPKTASLFGPCITALGFCLHAASKLCSCSPPSCLPVTAIDVCYSKLSASPACRRGDAGVIKYPPYPPVSQEPAPPCPARAVANQQLLPWQFLCRAPCW